MFIIRISNINSAISRYGSAGVSSRKIRSLVKIIIAKRLPCLCFGRKRKYD
ncbi:MAG: hypothetical protein ABJA79_10580 [Parafilimonas sp.]